MSEQMHCWRVYFEYKECGHTRTSFGRVIAPDVDSAIATVKPLFKNSQTVTSVQHDGPIDAVYTAQEQGK